MRTLSLVQTAGLIADIESMPSELVPLQLRRVRMLATKDLIPVEREAAGRQEGKLTFEGVCRARLASILIDLGFDAETLRAVSARFDLKWPPAFGGMTNFEAAAKAVIASESVTLELNLFLDRTTGRKHPGVCISGAEPVKSARVVAALAHVVSQAKVEVPLNALWLPIHEHFRAL